MQSELNARDRHSSLEFFLRFKGDLVFEILTCKNEEDEAEEEKEEEEGEEEEEEGYTFLIARTALRLLSAVQARRNSLQGRYNGISHQDRKTASWVAPRPFSD
uniref:Uncharacterized protein n=1 Tax=Vespula pensylvanica TaxID=30213 RepID=A0A834NFB7_VESPE|nr:hypothetical protein H0235_014551 [Vespula pensylvanica]